MKWTDATCRHSAVRSLTLGAVLLISAASLGCGQAKGAEDVRRDAARATVTLIASATAAADEACSVAIGATKNEALGEHCTGAYNAARSALLAAQASIDIYDSGGRGDVSCAVVRAVGALSEIASLLNTVSMPPPATVRDAISLGSRLGFECGDAS